MQYSGGGAVGIKNRRSCLETRLFIPHWWVRTFENILCLDWQKLSYKHFQQGGIVPSYTIADFYVFSFILGYIQKSLLANSASEEIVIEPGIIGQQVGAGVFKNKQKLSKMVASLESIMLLGSTGDKLRTHHLFKNSSFSQGLHGEYNLHLGLNLDLVEALFGYVDAYENLVRLPKKSLFDMQELVGKKAPLQLWRSLWLDMKGAEQALLLRVEKSVQWEEQLVHFSGVYQQCVKELFTHLTLGGKKQLPLSPLQKIIGLKRFAKKLSEHGFCSFALPRDYFAFTKKDRGVQLLFRLQEPAISAKEDEAYRSLVARYYFDRLISSDEKKFALVAALQGDPVFASEILGFLQTVHSRSGEKAKEVGYSLIDSNRLALLPLTYLEWSLRKNLKHPKPLPDLIAQDEIAKLLASKEDSPADLASKYERFVQDFALDTKYSYYLETLPGITLVSAKSNEEGEKISSVVPAASSVASIASDVSAKQALINSPNPIMIKPIRVEAETSPQQTKAGDRFELKDTANAVLHKLSLERGDSYIRLTNSYIESLDQRQKQLMLDIRKQMQAKTFDQHIRDRLLQFMLANPRVWQEYLPH